MNGAVAAAPWPLRFQVGVRTLATTRRRLVRLPLSLDEALAGRVPPLPPLAAGDDGYLVTSMPVARLAALAPAGLLVAVRQRYRRYWVDLTIGEAGWLAGLSANTRWSIGRKRRRMAAGPGFAITRHATPDDIARFHPAARAVSALTYQETLLDGGLPVTLAPLLAQAAADRVRAWLLWRDGRAIAYLCCTAEGETIRYDHVGHDPAFAALSPGSVLLAAAIADLLAEERFARFDFTEGEGQHKRGFATGGVDCVDVLILRAGLANRMILVALAGFDAAVAVAKRATRHPVAARLARRMRR